ncbi:MAG: transporter substrate-binding domain-containing protein [Cohaesibacter sp.]|nr:transporter substrate-binding domain-containing protein [Cohaesibacter sp.]MCV6603350.1 transporter substrate-binding domain-containing protein [Cohaesibacter sp.]
MSHAQQTEALAQEQKASSLTDKGDPAQTGTEEEELSPTWGKAPFANFIDTRTRKTAPDAIRLEKGLRILTADKFPPFNYIGSDGRPKGYHIDLAKLICDDLNIACTIKVVELDAIPDLLAQGEADIAVAGLLQHPTLRDTIGFSLSYLQRPARFLIRKNSFLTISPSALAEKPVAVVGRTAHEAYLKTYFKDVKAIAVADLLDAQTLLEEEKVVAIFADAMHLLQMLSESEGKFAFRAGPYLDQHFFGQGMAIAYQRQQQELRGLLDYALIGLAKKGQLAELYARYFPLDIYGQH